MDVKKLTALATTALAAVTLGACSMGQSVDQKTQGVDLAEAGLANASFSAEDCMVQGMSRNSLGAAIILHDFSNSVSSFQKPLNGISHQYSVAFNDVTNRAQQERIVAAHSLLPASANCPAPVFAPTTR